MITPAASASISFISFIASMMHSVVAGLHAVADLDERLRARRRRAIEGADHRGLHHMALRAARARRAAGAAVPGVANGRRRRRSSNGCPRSLGAPDGIERVILTRSSPSGKSRARAIPGAFHELDQRFQLAQIHRLIPCNGAMRAPARRGRLRSAAIDRPQRCLESGAGTMTGEFRAVSPVCPVMIVFDGTPALAFCARRRPLGSSFPIRAARPHRA